MHNLSIIKIRCLLFWVVLILGKLEAQDLYFVDASNNLYKENGFDCNPELVVNIGSFFSDISFHPNSKLYGIKGNGNLYQIDTVEGNIELIYTFEGTSYNSLVVSEGGVFFTIGTSGQLRSYDLSTGIEVFHGELDVQAGGDLTFIDGELYLGENGGRITKLDLNEIANVELVLDLGVSGSIIGLSAERINCDSVILYAILTGISSGGANIYRVDLPSQNISLVCDLPYLIKGSAMINEFAGSLDESETFKLDSIAYQIPSCDSIVNDIQLNISYSIGEVNFILDDTLFSSDNFFYDVVPGLHLLEGVDEIGCMISETIELSCNDLVNSSPEITPSTLFEIYPNPSNGVFFIMTDSSEMNSLAIFDLQGNTIDFTLTKMNEGYCLELSSKIPGSYFIIFRESVHKLAVF